MSWGGYPTVAVLGRYLHSVNFIYGVYRLFVLCCRARPERSQSLDDWYCSSPCPAKLVWRGVRSVLLWKTAQRACCTAWPCSCAQLSAPAAGNHNSRAGSALYSMLSNSSVPDPTTQRGEKLVGKSVRSLSATKQLVVSRRESSKIERQRQGEK